jgi:hypothetical protein
MKKLIIKTTAIILLLSAGTILFAEDKISFRTNLFSDNTGTEVKSPAVELIKGLIGDLQFMVRYSLDRVIIPPIRGLSATPSPTDAVTGASRPVDDENAANKSFNKDRNEIIAGFSLPRVSGSFYYSNESDYLGKMATIAANTDLNQRNTNVAVNYSYGWDKIKPLGTDTLHTKEAHSANATITQVLSPNMIARIGVDLSYVRGFQSNPYRTVNAGGQIFLERHPMERKRGAVFFKLNRYFKTQTAVNMEYRYYHDNWGVQSHTLSFFYHQYFSDKVLFRYRYRYYLQTAANFYQTSYSTVMPLMTSDYKLQAFNAHLFGLKIEYKLADLVKDGFLGFLSSSTFEAKYERYFSSNDFAANIFQFGLIINY